MGRWLSLHDFRASSRDLAQLCGHQIWGDAQSKQVEIARVTDMAVAFRYDQTPPIHGKAVGSSIKPSISLRKASQGSPSVLSEMFKSDPIR